MAVAPPPGRPKAGQAFGPEPRSGELPSPPSAGRGVGGRQVSPARYDEAAVLARETSRRMAARLDLVNIAPRCIADIGCATGEGLVELQRRFPQALPLAIEPSLSLLRAVRERATLMQRLRGRAPRCINAGAGALPLAGGAIDMAWSNLALHWQDDLAAGFAELHRVLGVGGLLMFSMFGPDTLKELRAACAKVGAGDTARRFADMHDIGDMLVHAGFADPVMDMEMITLTYATPRALLRDLRHLGVGAAMLGQPQPLWRDLRRALLAWAPTDHDRLPMSFEIVYGHAWKTAPKAVGDGSAVVRFRPR